MPEWEEQLLIKIVHSNPNITNQALAKKLGTGRNPAALHRKREKLFGREVFYISMIIVLYSTKKLLMK